MTRDRGDNPLTLFDALPPNVVELAKEVACQVPGRPKGGACRLSQATLVIITTGSECARGPMVEVAAPSGAGPAGCAG